MRAVAKIVAVDGLDQWRFVDDEGTIYNEHERWMEEQAPRYLGALRFSGRLKQLFKISAKSSTDGRRFQIVTASGEIVDMARFGMTRSFVWIVTDHSGTIVRLEVPGGASR